MRLYTVHQNPDPLSGNDLVFVKEGFCWPALFFGPFWAAFRGLWFWAVVWLLVAAGLALTKEAWPSAGPYVGMIGLALKLLFATEANDLRRRKLDRQGLPEVGVVGGPDHDTAARRYADLAAIAAH